MASAIGLVLGLALLLPPSPAGAQGARYQFGLPGFGLPEKGEYGPGILTAEQAEACLRRWRELEAAQAALERDQRQLDQLEAELYAPPQRAAAARRPAPRRGGQAQAVTPAVSPEQAEAERQAKFETANTLRRQYMDGVERQRIQVERFNLDCATRLYYEEDMRAARARLGID
ncbi:MAG: hypothetical protein IRZ13_14065 [Acetobacteraceae bacterium]|nr:hypothetical protein [Acetobacteraceae bacterium]